MDNNQNNQNNQYQPQNNQYQPQQPQYQPQPPVPGKSAATCALACGIISVVLCWLGYVTWAVGSVIALVLGIVACVQGAKAKKLMPQGQSGMATAGLVLGIIGVVFSAIFSVCSIIAYAYVCSEGSALGLW